ncbi:MAG: glutathione S-transferase family protein [Rhizobiaceae bacterium]
MNELIIWGRATSSNVQAVMWTVAELGLDYIRHNVGGAFGGTDTAEFRAMNPMGLVPVLQDGDLEMFESAAIVRYLGAQYGSEVFWPSDPKTRARSDMIAEWAKHAIYRSLTLDVFWQLVRTPSAQRDPNVIERGKNELARLLPMAGSWLGDKAYLGGDDICFADIIFGHFLYRYYALDFERSDTPTLDVYYERLTNRLAYAEHVMVDYSPLQVD